MRQFVLAALLASAPLLVIAQRGGTVAFVDVNVVPMDTERVLERQTVIVRDGRIASIGPAAQAPVPEGAERVDGRGKYLLPGLSDMHGHLPPGDGTSDDAVSQFLKLYVANGVTLVRGMIGSPNNIVVRERIARGELLGPAIVAASPPIHAKTAPTPDAGVEAVEQAKAAGYDLLKVHEGLSPETYAAVTAAARRLDMKVAGHVTATVGLDRALAASQSSIEHLDGYLQALVPEDAKLEVPAGQVLFGPVLEQIDESRIPELARRTKAAGVWNTPTLALFEIVMSTEPPATFTAWPEMKYVAPGLRSQFAKQKAGTAGIPAPPADRARYLELRRKVVKGLRDAGAPLLVGPDTPQLFLVPGFGTHREMTSLVQAGLSPYEALRAATVSAAEYLGREREMGTIATGRKADLVLVDENPLADIASVRSIAGVVVNGRWIPKKEIDTMLEQIAAMHADQK
jgi:imidazolonepropionase-like amidohydrolase